VGRPARSRPRRAADSRRRMGAERPSRAPIPYLQGAEKANPASGGRIGDGYIFIYNKGAAMEKLIRDGASVVIDVRSREIVSGGVYAISVPGEGIIIRECHSGPGGLLLTPYNRNYPEHLLPWDEFEPEAIVGKVFCSVLNVFG
jgi:phage repressor protein C with HTH and peptisase S24 domain